MNRSLSLRALSRRWRQTIAALGVAAALSSVGTAEDALADKGPADQGVVEVRVVEGAGAPLAGARVSLFDFDFDRDWRRWVMSLVGREPPELDGAHWLNAKSGTRLADFRGKYVLLHFWTTWCGPCHADLQSIRLVQELYGDHGFTMIGVHDNSMPLAAIEADSARSEMNYPIVVDNPDGRLMARYKEHGVSGVPSYVLIGPDGRVLQDDDAAQPSLRNFKIEIVRALLSPQSEAER